MSNYLPTDYQSFIHTSRYARWLEDEGRRENWDETVQRYIKNVVYKAFPHNPERTWQGRPLTQEELAFDWGKVEREIRDSILGLEVMPSMRAMMTAGPAATRDNTCM